MNKSSITKITATLLAVLLLSGCAAPQKENTSQPLQVSSGQSQQEPEALGAATLTVGTTSKIEKASRADYYFDVLSGTLSQLALVSMDEGGAYHPLAADYKTDDGKTWIFTLKEGLKWQDGVPVTSQDVRFTIEYLDKQEPGKYLSRYEDIRTPDSRRVELVLKKANIRALADLTTMRLIPEHIYRDIPSIADATEEQATLGCGPYRFVRFDPNAGVLEFEANRDFGTGQQKLDRVLFRLYGNADTMYMALKTGELDMVYSYAGGVEPEAARDLAKSDKLTLTALKDTGNTAVLVFNNNKAPWDNLALRRAVYYALDYDKFRELFGSEYSVPATAGFLPVGSFGYLDTPVNRRNLEEAKKLLKEAGAVDSNHDGILELSGQPLTLELLLRNDKPVYQRYGELAQANLKEAGIAVTLKLAEVPQFRTITEQEHTNQAVITKFTAFGMGMGGGVGSDYLDGRPEAIGQGQLMDPAFHTLVDGLKAADTLEKYAAAAAACQRYYADQLPAIALYWDSYIQATSNRLSGFVVDGTFGLLNTDSWFSLEKN